MSAQPEFDSEEWREKRNIQLAEWLADEHAERFVRSMFNVAEVWDDLRDNDRADPDQVNRAFQAMLFGLERNPFWCAHRTLLSVMVEQMVMEWESANALERSPVRRDRERAFFLRDSPTRLVGLVATLLHGHEHGQRVTTEAWRFFPHEELSQWEYADERRR